MIKPCEPCPELWEGMNRINPDSVEYMEVAGYGKVALMFINRMVLIHTMPTTTYPSLKAIKKAFGLICDMLLDSGYDNVCAMYDKEPTDIQKRLLKILGFQYAYDELYVRGL